MKASSGDQNGPGAEVFRFGLFELDPRCGELRKGGRRIRVQEQPFQVLLLLLERAGDLITRDELRDRLWSDRTFVDFDHGIRTAINKLRDALGDDAENPRFIETVPRRGYRFVAPVEPAGPAAAAIAHYRMLEEIGRGAMGIVYRAEDLSLGRQVAVKVLTPELAADPQRKARLIREARAASALNHPNIITVHDVGSDGGTDFIVMELVHGEPLNAFIPAKGMPVNEALRLAVQIADGLAAAHAAGILHRDLKPDNIMVTGERRAKLLDFGLARFTEGSGQATQTQTLQGAVVGTYMSPEQAEGKPVDARSDIFSFGAVLYEMVTGLRAFARDTHIDTLAAILHEEPPAPSLIVHGLPAELERVILRCLRKEPAARFLSIGEVRVALEELARELDSARAAQSLRETGRERPLRTWHDQRWSLAMATVALAGVAAVLVGLNGANLRDRLLGRVGTPRIESLAVLPLANLSGDPQQEYFADGMTEELITDLGKVGALRVISRTSVMKYKRTKKALPAIAQELNVDAVVEGSVLRSGNRVRITAQLIQAKAERHLWGESYERDLRDILALQSEVAEAIARHVQAKVIPQEQMRLAVARRVNPEAHEAYLKGRYYENFFPEGTGRAVECFQNSIEKDSNYAPAYARLALNLDMLGFFQPPKAVYPKAKAAALRALELDSNLAEAQTAIGLVKLYFDWDWTGTELAWRRALQLNPNSVAALRLAAEHLVFTGQFDEGIAHARRARDLDPANRNYNDLVGYLGIRGRRYDDAIAEFRRILELDRNATSARIHLAWAYTFKGMYAEAMAEFQKMGEVTNNSANPWLGFLYAKMGLRGAAQRVADNVRRASTQHYIDAYWVAVPYAALADTDQAFGWLEKAYHDRSPFMAQLRADAFVDPLRSDPRFQDLLRRMNFPP